MRYRRLYMVGYRCLYSALSSALQCIIVGFRVHYRRLYSTVSYRRLYTVSYRRLYIALSSALFTVLSSALQCVIVVFIQ